ncbi:hypothetical protein Moror_5637 [Moniliophthora roreri MCA 2997]|uniref:Uncharacterized protein n=2 Tax=Moniliophthora roreri TaxID=221103 RepID=V2XTN1_MONRO|nr:hypothetical protein Moror_5637 [Moniliophthora roreri MCA 2997]KAI3620806.1 hypothetical protein WG66_011366 [Moniliophthora roreri]
MAPLSTSVLKNMLSAPLNESVAVKNDFSSPSSVILESVLTSTAPSFPHPLIITLLILVALYIFIPRIFNWRYPVQSAETLQKMVDSLEQSIKDNSRIVNGRNVLKESRREVKRKLKLLHAQVNTLKNRAEPPRSNLLTWAIFRLNMVWDVDECYLGLTTLEAEIEDKLDLAQDEHHTTSVIQAANAAIARNCTSTMRVHDEV